MNLLNLSAPATAFLLVGANVDTVSTTPAHDMVIYAIQSTNNLRISANPFGKKLDSCQQALQLISEMNINEINIEETSKTNAKLECNLVFNDSIKSFSVYR
jgi:hypothetical protein